MSLKGVSMGSSQDLNKIYEAMEAQRRMNEYHLRQQQNMHNWNQSYNKPEVKNPPKKFDEKDIIDAEFTVVEQKRLSGNK